MSIMYTAANLITEVRGLLAEPVARFWSDAELQIWIDWAARELSAITLCTPITEEVTTTTDTFSYALTAQFISIHSVMFNDTKSLQRLDAFSFGHGAQDGLAADTNREPSWYYVHGNRVYLWPVPKGSAVGASLIDVYGWRTAYAFERDVSRYPKQYDIPDPFQPLLVPFVMACARAKEQKHAIARIHMMEFLSRAGEARIDITDHSLRKTSNDQHAIPDQTVRAGQQG